ncbi:MAG TPA: TonB-dependent receptor plug domain-containing protein, partial [Usitatibacter sp.]|nr:TonB-dependent receptor plug domain-containing protein [Usitatibacter sp.]
MIRIRRSMGCASVAIAFAMTACIPYAVRAQANQAAKPEYTEKIEVTGSHLKRADGEGALPLTVISREEIERTGATTAMELLQYVSANASVGSVSLAVAIGLTNGPSTYGAQTANLRGLQGGRTLVLINGKRLDNFPGEVSGVEGQNLAVIPFSAIERVEVLRDGASAVYGSDAIAGVINFILRSDYRGAEATVWLGAPTRSGGGQQEVYSASMGFGDLSVDRYNAFFSAHYNDQHNLLQRDRDFSRGVYR